MINPGGATTAIDPAAEPEAKELVPVSFEERGPAETLWFPAIAPTTLKVRTQNPEPPIVPPANVKVVSPGIAVGVAPQVPLKPLGFAIFKPVKLAVKATPVKGIVPELVKLNVKVVVGMLESEGNGI